MNEGKIYKAISEVMADIGHIGKDDKNKQQGWSFRGVDAVMNALNPALVKHGIFVAPEVLEQTREERTTKNGSVLIYTILKMKYTFYAEDGSFVEAVTVGESMDSGDKSCNKAMSVAFKYAMFQTFCIPTVELMDEPDKEVHEDITPKSKKNNVKEYITPEQYANIISAITNRYEEKDRDKAYKDFCSAYDVKSLRAITTVQYDAILSKLRAA